MTEFDSYYRREFKDDPENQITVDEFINFLIDMIDEGISKDSKLNICGSDHFFFHYDKKSKKIRLDTKPLIEKYTKETSIEK